MMNEKIEINTLITKHENKCKDCRFDMIDVEDPLWEYGSPLKRVLIDNQTGETYDSVSKLVGLLNEQQDTIFKLQDLCGKSDGENAKLRIENKKLKAKLREKEEDEKLYANEILELRETNKEHIKFKSLGGNY